MIFITAVQYIRRRKRSNDFIIQYVSAGADCSVGRQEVNLISKGFSLVAFGGRRRPPTIFGRFDELDNRENSAAAARTCRFTAKTTKQPHQMNHCYNTVSLTNVDKCTKYIKPPFPKSFKQFFPNFQVFCVVICFANILDIMVPYNRIVHSFQHFKMMLTEDQPKMYLKTGD